MRSLPFKASLLSLLCNLVVKSEGPLWDSVPDSELQLKMLTEETARKTANPGDPLRRFHTVSFYGLTPLAAV